MTYDVAEIAKLIGVHRNTVGHWRKGGLATIDNCRPALVYGAALRAFLVTRRDAHRQRCAMGQFWCFKCRSPRDAWGGLADAVMQSDKVARLSSLCAVCETRVYRIVSAADLPSLGQLLNLQVVRGKNAYRTRRVDMASSTNN